MPFSAGDDPKSPVSCARVYSLDCVYLAEWKEAEPLGCARTKILKRVAIPSRGVEDETDHLESSEVMSAQYVRRIDAEAHGALLSFKRFSYSQERSALIS